MDTIADVTEDRPSAAAPDAVGQQRAALSAAGAAQRRSLLVPVLSTACAALIAGVLAMAVVGFNTLRDDMRSLDAKIETQIGKLRDDMHTQIGKLDAKIDTQIGMLRDDMNARFAQVDERFGEVNAILLDHTERLTRIETTLGVEPLTQLRP